MNKRTSVVGIILVVVGLLLLLSQFNIHMAGLVFPVAVILVGLWFIARHKDKQRESMAGGINININGGSQAGTATDTTYTATSAGPTGATGYQQTWSTAAPHVEAGKLKYSKFIGDMQIDCNNVQLQNVEISMFMGDLQVNLRGGKLSPGLNRMIISGFVGDVQIFVPKAMPVYAHCSGFAGDLDVMGRRTSGFGNTMDAQTESYEAAEARLYIAASHFIGDVRVYVV